MNEDQRWVVVWDDGLPTREQMEMWAHNGYFSERASVSVAIDDAERLGSRWAVCTIEGGLVVKVGVAAMEEMDGSGDVVVTWTPTGGVSRVVRTVRVGRGRDER